MITSMSGTQQQSEHQAGLFAPALPPRAEMERAFFASDPSYDGLFVTGVRTTGIFCRPSCRARKPLFTEKPLAPDYATVTEIVDLVES